MQDSFILYPIFSSLAQYGTNPPSLLTHAAMPMLGNNGWNLLVQCNIVPWFQIKGLTYDLKTFMPFL